MLLALNVFSYRAREYSVFVSSPHLPYLAPVEMNRRIAKEGCIFVPQKAICLPQRHVPTSASVLSLGLPDTPYVVVSPLSQWGGRWRDGNMLLTLDTSCL